MNPRLIPSSRLARATILRSQSDDRLRLLAGQGSDAAFEAIVHRYRRPLVGHCARVLSSSADAEEAVQDALISAHSALVNGNDVRALGPWLHAVAHNAALRVLRRRVARAEYPQEDCNNYASVDPPDTMRTELRDVVTAVQSLPPRQRDAIVMRELEGRSYAEIAARLGASDGAVRQLLNRARRSMRESLGALIPAEPLVRWLLSAEEGSPARGLLTLSGGSAIAIKVSGAAVLSAVSVVTLLPSTEISVRSPATGTRPVAALGASSARPSRLASAPSRAQRVDTAARSTARTRVSAVVSSRAANHRLGMGVHAASTPAAGRHTGSGGKRMGWTGSHQQSPAAQSWSGAATGSRTPSMPGYQGMGSPSPSSGNQPGTSMFESPRHSFSQPGMMPNPSPQPGAQPGSGAPSAP